METTRGRVRLGSNPAPEAALILGAIPEARAVALVAMRDLTPEEAPQEDWNRSNSCPPGGISPRIAPGQREERR